MKKRNSNENGGFTIIEVTLVLAIAGLIFLMAFLALPALQRSQRDSRRRDDVMHFLSELKSYQTNNRGNLPAGNSEWSTFWNKYLGSNFIDPDGRNYTYSTHTCGDKVKADEECADSGYKSIYSSSFPYSNYKMVIITNATCYGDKPVKTSNKRNAAVLYRLEGAGVYCNSTSS